MLAPFEVTITETADDRNIVFVFEESDVDKAQLCLQVYDPDERSVLDTFTTATEKQTATLTWNVLLDGTPSSNILSSYLDGVLLDTREITDSDQLTRAGSGKSVSSVVLRV